MNRNYILAIVLAALAPLLLTAGGAPGRASLTLGCDTMSVSADSLLKETPLFDRLYLDAVCQHIAGDDSTAFALLEQCRQMRPDAAEVYYSQTPIYAKRGNDSLAIESMRRAAELQPDNDNYQENVAETYIHQRDYERAIEAYEKLYQHHRNRSDVLDILVRLYNATGNYEKMLSTVDRMEQADGASEELTFIRMGIYEQQGDKKNAYRILKSLTDDHPNEPSYKVMLGNWLMQHERQSEAYKWFMSALEDDRQNEFALNSLYDYYRNAGDDDAARKLRDDLLASTQTAAKTKISMLQQAIQENEREQGDSMLIVDMFNRAIKATPHDADLSNLKAAYMSIKKMPQDSIRAAYAYTLSFEPDNYRARLTLAQYLWNQEKWDEVIDLCCKGIPYTPEEVSNYYFVGLAYLRKGDDNEAYNILRRGLEAFKAEDADEFNKGLASDMYGLTADIEYSRGDTDESFASYEKALKLKPDNISVMNNYAYYLSQVNKNLERAAEMSMTTIKEEPTNPTYLDTYAWIMFLQKRYDEAKAYIELVLEYDEAPGAVEYEHAGDIYVMAGDKEKAVEMWQKAIDAGGDKTKLANKIKTRKL